MYEYVQKIKRNSSLETHGNTLKKCHSYLAEVVTSAALGDIDQSSGDKRIQWIGDGEELQQLVIHSYILDAAFEIPAISMSFFVIW